MPLGMLALRLSIFSTHPPFCSSRRIRVGPPLVASKVRWPHDAAPTHPARTSRRRPRAPIVARGCCRWKVGACARLPPDTQSYFVLWCKTKHWSGVTKHNCVACPCHCLAQGHACHWACWLCVCLFSPEYKQSYSFLVVVLCFCFVFASSPPQRVWLRSSDEYGYFPHLLRCQDYLLNEVSPCS